MKHLLCGAIAATFAASVCAAPVHPDSTGFKFTDVKVVKTNPVRNQASSGTCWCFSSNSFFENELIRKTGSAPDLSEMFVVWHTYDDKADKYIRMNGKIRRVARATTYPTYGLSTVLCLRRSMPV